MLQLGVWEKQCGWKWICDFDLVYKVRSIIYMKIRALMCPSNMYWTVFLSIHKYALSAAAEHFQRNTIFSWHSRTISGRAIFPTPRIPHSVAVCISGKFWHVAICVGLNAVLKIKRCYTQEGRLIAIAEQRASAEYDKSLQREAGPLKKNRCSVAFRRSFSTLSCC
jgi:hypothetical protein